MSDQPSSEKRVNSPKYLSLIWLIVLVAGLCVVPPVAGAVAKEVGGLLGWGIWFLAWGVMFVVSWILTRTFANPMLPTLCGVMVGVTFPRPSDERVRQFAGEGWVGFIEYGMLFLGIAVGLTIFNAIAKRHKA
jgi:hypothetical protein